MLIIIKKDFIFTFDLEFAWAFIKPIKLNFSVLSYKSVFKDVVANFIYGGVTKFYKVAS